MSLLSSLQALDVQALESVRHALTLHTPWFQTLILTLSDSEPILFALFLIGLWLFGRFHHDDGVKYVALDLFWHVMVAFAIYWIINHLLPMRPRPELFTELPPLLNHLPDNSFPSGHALFWGASWWALHKLLWRPLITWSFFVIGALTCLTRIIAGIHYPGDIIVGFLLGWTLVAWITWLPHGRRYRRYTQDIPLQIARKIGL